MKRVYSITKKNRKPISGGVKNEQKKYPPLPESPTNRPPVLTNNESLLPPKKNSNQYKKRHNRLINIFTKARERTLKNIILRRKRPEPKLNSSGYLKSAFTINNDKIGFKKV
jgi:hypothetical protein